MFNKNNGDDNQDALRQAECATDVDDNSSEEQKHKKSRTAFRERFCTAKKKICLFAKKCFTLKNVAITLSVISVAYAGVSIIQGGYFFIGGAIAVADQSDSLPLPPEMQDMSLDDIVELWKDSYEHDWEKYNKQFIENVSGKVYGHTNYNQGTTIKVTSLLSSEVGVDECKMRVFVTKDRNGDICRGSVTLNMEYPEYKEYEDMPFMEYDFYQILGEDSFDLYFEYAGNWYYTNVSNEVETIINDSPDKYFDLFKEHTSAVVPLGRMISLPMSVLDDVYPFNLYAPKDCSDVLYDYSILLFEEETDYLKGVFHGPMGNRIQLDKMQQFVDQGDTAVEFFLNSYVTDGFALIGFGDYGQIDEIVIPEEIFQAKPFDEKVKARLCDDVIDFIERNQAIWKERLIYAHTHE